jgi:pseudouridine kinase
MTMYSTDHSFRSDDPVLVIGSAGVDIVGRVKGELKRETSSPAQIRQTFGGAARNVAENLARLGQPATLLTAIGADEAGEALLAALVLAGVDVSAILRLPERQTGSYLAIVNSRGALQFALDDMHITTEISRLYLLENIELFESASMVFVDANLSKESLRTVFSLARRFQLPVCADPTSISLAVKLKPYLNRLYLVTPNHYEAEVLCDRPIGPASPERAMQAARHLVNCGVEIAIVTLAELGLCYASNELRGQISAIRNEIVDPTGAGDALTAAVMFGLLNDVPLDEAMRLGVSAAALTMGYPGAVRPDLTVEMLYNQLVI